MILEYLEAALGRARYETINDEEPFYGEIPDCPGVWASGTTEEECRRRLAEALDGWLILSLQRGLPIPQIDGLTMTVEDPTPVNG